MTPCTIKQTKEPVSVVVDAHFESFLAPATGDNDDGNGNNVAAYDENTPSIKEQVKKNKRTQAINVVTVLADGGYPLP
ncbi:hypothetical protein KM043_008009 [Ampulex compressa]|nr:hypothetical protein KM043_008009 [Ampulex compressa]